MGICKIPLQFHFSKYYQLHTFPAQENSDLSVSVRDKLLAIPKEVSVLNCIQIWQSQRFCELETLKCFIALYSQDFQQNTRNIYSE